MDPRFELEKTGFKVNWISLYSSHEEKRFWSRLANNYWKRRISWIDRKKFTSAKKNLISITFPWICIQLSASSSSTVSDSPHEEITKAIWEKHERKIRQSDSKNNEHFIKDNKKQKDRSYNFTLSWEYCTCCRLYWNYFLSCSNG